MPKKTLVEVVKIKSVVLKLNHPLRMQTGFTSTKESYICVFIFVTLDYFP
jgi:hypothetical protein